MKKGTTRIIVTSERVNNYGFRVLTDGIDLSQYDKNPLMLWMHIRPFGSNEDQILALGNVIELRREDDPELGKIITGLPVFDETDSFAMRIYNKYANGTYRMASAGLRPVEWSDAPEHLIAGQRCSTLVRSQLEEISLCDLGGNDDALTVALYNEVGEVIQLSLNGDNAAIPLITHNQIKNEMSKIELTAAKAAVMLGLKDVSSADEFETKVMEVVQLAHTQKTQIETLTREKKELETKLTAAQQAGIEEAAKVMLSKAVEERRITADETEFYSEQITDQTSFDKVKLHLEGKPAATSVEAAIKLSANKSADTFAGKSWDELDKGGQLVQLKAQNLTLFKDLFKAKFNKEYTV